MWRHWRLFQSDVGFFTPESQARHAKKHRGAFASPWGLKIEALANSFGIIASIVHIPAIPSLRFDYPELEMLSIRLTIRPVCGLEDSLRSGLPLFSPAQAPQRCLLSPRASPLLALSRRQGLQPMVNRTRWRRGVGGLILREWGFGPRW